MKGLLAQDDLLDVATFEAQRARFRERLARAEQQERTARRITVGTAVVCWVGFAALYAFAVRAAGDAQEWPDGLKLF